MKQSRSWVMGALFAAVLSVAFIPFSPHTAAAQTDAAGVAGAYAEEVASDASAEVFTTFILHADGTMTLVDSSDTQQLVFVGAWRQVDASTVEATVIGANIPLPSEPGGMTPPSLEVSERDYMVIFQDNTFQTATVSSTRGTVDSFTAQRVAAPMPPAPAPTPGPAPAPTPAPAPAPPAQ